MDATGFLTPKFLVLMCLASTAVGRQNDLIDSIKSIGSKMAARNAHIDSKAAARDAHIDSKAAARDACAAQAETTFKSIGKYFTQSEVEPSGSSAAKGFLAKIKSCRRCVPYGDPEIMTENQLLHHEVIGMIRKAHKDLNETAFACVKNRMIEIFFDMVDTAGDTCIKDDEDSKFVFRHSVESLLTGESKQSHIDFVESTSVEFEKLIDLPEHCQEDNSLCVKKSFRDVHASALVHIAKTSDGSEASTQCFKRIDGIREQICSCHSLFGMNTFKKHYHKFLKIDGECKKGFVKNFLKALSAILRKNRKEARWLILETTIPEISRIVFGKGHDLKVYYYMLCENMDLSHEFLTSNDVNTVD